MTATTPLTTIPDPPVSVLVLALSAEVCAARSSPSAIRVAAEITVAHVSVRRSLGSTAPAPANRGVLQSMI